MIRVPNIKLFLDEEESALKPRVAKALRIRPGDITQCRISKKSVDARDKQKVHFVCTVDAAVALPEDKVLRPLKEGVARRLDTRDAPPPPPCAFAVRPVVVGLGPCGLFAALTLAQSGARPLIIERGDAVHERARKVSRFMRCGELDENSNIQFGEGGAGAFSDGKLTTGIKDSLLYPILQTLVRHGAPEDILYEQRPHIGTDKLPHVVQHIREEIVALGGEVRFNTLLSDVIVENGALRGVVLSGGGQQTTEPCTHLLLAMGHSARDTYHMLHQRGVAMEQKPFSVGVRLEHKQAFIDRAQYGDFAGHPKLEAAEYHLAVKTRDGRGVYSFCMCPGGTVVPAASEKNRLCTNGMSVYKRDGENANAGILVDVRLSDFPSPHPLSGIEFQRAMEERAFLAGGGNYHAPAQLVGDFLQRVPSRALGSVSPTYLPGITLCNLHEVLPPFVAQALHEGLGLLDKRIRGFAAPDAVMTAAETRSSSPVRIPRDATGQCSIRGLYPGGEGAGMAGGIMSAAVDGIRLAHAMMQRAMP